jgi:hypothetical protein
LPPTANSRGIRTTLKTQNFARKKVSLDVNDWSILKNQLRQTLLLRPLPISRHVLTCPTSSLKMKTSFPILTPPFVDMSLAALRFTTSAARLSRRLTSIRMHMYCPRQHQELRED